MQPGAYVYFITKWVFYIITYFELPGVLLHEIVNIMQLVVAGDQEQAKLHLYSAHETNVAALLAALKIFKPHQPKYGSSIALELRRNLRTGKHGVMVILAFLLHWQSHRKNLIHN